MAVIQKTLFAKNLSNYSVLVNDLDPNSKYFKISELSDTFTGGKNAFLIAGSENLVADTKIQIELKDSAGNIIYNEPGEGIINTNISGSTNQSIITEYYEGVSKVVAVYIYPDTAFGACTLTILGELSQYVDENGITQLVPPDWENKYNVKWEKTINVNPTLANTTKIRFYKRPTVAIDELISPVYRIDTNTGVKINTGINQSFANIKVSNLETFAGDVKRIKVFRTSLGDISDYDMIQDILVESKELLTSYGLSGSVVGNTGILTSETFKNYWLTGSLLATLDSNRVEAGAKLKGAGNFTYSASLDLKSANTYELNLDAFYSASTNSNLGIYIVSGSYVNNIATLSGINPTKNLLDTTIPFKLDRDCTPATLYFSQSQDEWHLGNISLKLSEDTAFSPDEVSFITTMPTVVGNEDFNFKFEFCDVNNNYVPVLVTGSANFTGGSNTIAKLLTFESDRTAFRFSTGSYANPTNQNVRFKTIKTNFTGSITYASAAFDVGGTYIDPITYTGTYPGWFTSQNDNGALLSISSFSGSVASVLVGSIVYTASCEGVEEYETIYRFEDGDNAPGVFVTSNTNQFIYKATNLSLNPTGQVITIEAKRKNLASATTPLTVNSGSGKPPLTFVSTNATNGVDTYTLAGSAYAYSVGESIYYISGSDQFGNEFSDAVKISPVKILDGLSATLTNDNASLPTLSNGFVASGSFILTSGSVTVKVGNESISFDDDNDSNRANNTFAITNLSGTGCTPNGGDNSNPSTNSYSITNLTADSGSLDITISYKDGSGDTTSIVKTATYTKNKKAAPVLQISSTPKDQTVTAKSTGEQIDSFSNVIVSVKQTYDGATTNLTITSLAATSANISNISTTPSTGLITLNGKVLANGVNSTTIDITAVVTDAEGVSRTITDTLALSKTKKAAPNIVVSATPQAQSVLANAAGVQTGALTNVTITALEGTTSMFTSMTATYSGFSTNPIISTNTLTTSAAVMNSAEASATIVVTHTDSEGTTGQTQTIIVRFTKVPTGTAGTPGLNGADGGSGPGVVYRGDWAANTAYFSSSVRVDVVRGSNSQYYLAKVGHTSTGTGALDKPITGTSYTTYWNAFGATFSSVATDILLAQDATITRGLVMGTYGATDKGFIRSANATALMTGKGYYLDTTGSMRFGDPSGGYIKFTESEGVTISGDVSISGTATIGGTSATAVKDGAALGNTAQQNTSDKTAGKVGGWKIDSDSIFSGTKDISGYSTTGITLNSGGSIHAPQFYIDTDGSASFKGTLSAAGGTFAGQIVVGGTNYNLSETLNSNTTKSQVGLSDVSNLNPQNQAQTGIIAGTTITGGGITLSGGGNIKGGQTAYNTGTGFFLGYSDSLYRFSIGNPTGDYLTYNGAGTLAVGGTINATAGQIGGWTIGGGKIYVANKLELDAVATYPSINIFGNDGVPRVIINNSPSLSSLTGGGAGSGAYPSTSGGNGLNGATKYFNPIDMPTVAGAIYNLVIAFTEPDSSYACNFVPLTSTGNINWGINMWNTALTLQGQSVYDGITDTLFNQSVWTWTLLGGVNGIAAYANVTGDGTTLKIRPYMRYNGSAGSARDMTFPSFTYSWVQTVSKTEIIPGGMQIVNSTAAYLKADRTVTDSAATPWMTSAGNWKHNGTLITNSDRNIKSNIIPIDFNLEKLNEIDGYSYDKTIDYDGDGNGDVVISTYGIIAQEIETILPNAVSTNASDGIKGVDYNAVTGMLLSAVKKLYLKVVELENRISGSI
jgi:hypothetical protein